MSQELGLESPAVPRIATGFGGGISRMGEVCGALTGAVMALGLKYGREQPQEPGAAAAAYPYVQRLYRRFHEEMGSPLCRQLTGFDLSTTEGYQQFRASPVRLTVCPKAVETAARVAVELAQSG